MTETTPQPQTIRFITTPVTECVIGRRRINMREDCNSYNASSRARPYVRANAFTWKIVGTVCVITTIKGSERFGAASIGERLNRVAKTEERRQARMAKSV